MRCTPFRRDAPIRGAARRVALFLLVGLVGGSAVGCASGLFARGGPSREVAIAHCIETIPAESVPFGDLFAACMEEQGWEYTGPND